MKRVIFFIVLGCELLACSPKVQTAELSLKTHTQTLLKNEQFISGHFFELRRYNKELLESAAQPIVAPYTTLDSIFNLSYKQADSVALLRIAQASMAGYCDSLQLKQKKVSTNSAAFEKAERYKKQSVDMCEQSAQHYSSYLMLENAYYDVVNKNGISRINSQDYAARLNNSLVQWQDSLEQIGRIIAAEKVHLKSKFPEQKGADFFSHYAHISQLEAQLKAFDSSIMQLQNTLSRFEGAGNQEYYYFGPGIEPRREVLATEGILENLSVAMEACRQKEKEYYHSFHN